MIQKEVQEKLHITVGYICIAVKAQMNLRVRKYTRGVRGRTFWFADHLWCVLVLLFSTTVSVIFCLPKLH